YPLGATNPAFLKPSCVEDPMTWCAPRVFNEVPSPVGESLFRSVQIADSLSTLDLDSVAIYAYSPCSAGTCQGYAWQIWGAMPRAQREAYLGAVLDVFVSHHPWATPSITVNQWVPTVPGSQPQGMPVAYA